MRTLRWLAVAALASLVLASPVAADGPQTVDTTCRETTVPTVGIPDLPVPFTLGATDSADPARVFQPVTWTAELGVPDLGSPFTLTMNYLRVRLPVPDGLAAVSARVVAPPGETPNPPLADISVTVGVDEIAVQLPATPDTTHRFLVAADSQGGAITYPYLNIFSLGQPVVLPDIEITGVPTPALAGTTVSWSAPEIDASAILPLAGSPVGTLTCTPDLDPDPVVATTDVSTAVQTCDGRPVTVQVGHNAPTNGNDVIQGTAGNDTVNAKGGADRFCGLNGNDTYNGGGGNDRARGGNGNDKLRGDAGNDTLLGEGGNDTLTGGTQRDTCSGSTGRDTAATCEVRTGIP